MSDFKKASELIAYLEDGGEIVSKGSEVSNRIFFIQGNTLFSRLKNINTALSSRIEANTLLRHLNQWKKYEEPKWYDNIPPEGYLCKVSNSLCKDAIRTIHAVVNDRYIHKSNAGAIYFNKAIPLTPQEIETLTYRG